MKARDIMTARPYVVMAEEPIGNAAAIMGNHDVGMVPVVDDYAAMRVLGVITDRDIAVRHVGNTHVGECIVRDHMTKAPLDIVNEHDHVHDVIGRMLHDQVRRLLVVDDRHRLVGVIAQADVARKVGPIEPELVEEMLERISEPAAELSD